MLDAPFIFESAMTIEIRCCRAIYEDDKIINWFMQTIDMLYSCTVYKLLQTMPLRELI